MDGGLLQQARGILRAGEATAPRARRLCSLCILALLLLCEASAVPVRHPGRLSRPDYTVYYGRDKLLEEVVKIVQQHGDVMKMQVVHAEDKGYGTDMQIVTVEPGGHTDDHSSKIRILLDFGEHARELVSSETGLRLLRILADPDEIRRVTGEMYPQVAALLPHTVFKILPMENTQGRHRVEIGQLCERKNGRGVDPNRNWEVDWGVKEHDYDPKEEYPGTHPFSEPEVQIVKKIADEWHPHVWVNVHSGMEALFMPFDHKAVIPEGVGGQAQLAMLKHLNKLVCGNRCAVGSGGKSVGYLAHGTATDHMYLKENVPLAFTWEIYGDMHAHYLDCFKMFNPITREHLDSVVSAWAPGFLYLVALLPAHPAMASFMEQAGIPLPQHESHRQASNQQQGPLSRPLMVPEQARQLGGLQLGAAADARPRLPWVDPQPRAIAEAGGAGASASAHTGSQYAQAIASAVDAHAAAAAAKSAAAAAGGWPATRSKRFTAAWWWPLAAVCVFFAIAVVARAAGSAIKRRRRRGAFWASSPSKVGDVEDPRKV